MALLLGVGIIGAGAYALAKPAAAIKNPGIKNLGHLLTLNGLAASRALAAQANFVQGDTYTLTFNVVNSALIAAAVANLLTAAGWSAPATNSGGFGGTDWNTTPQGGLVTVAAVRTGPTVDISTESNADVDPSQLQLIAATGPDLPATLPATPPLWGIAPSTQPAPPSGQGAPAPPSGGGGGSLLNQAGQAAQNAGSSLVSQAGQAAQNAGSSLVSQAGQAAQNAGSSLVSQAGQAAQNTGSSLVSQAGQGASDSGSSLLNQADQAVTNPPPGG